MTFRALGYFVGFACLFQVTAFNITHVLIHYVHVCGFEHLCNSSIIEDVLGYKPVRKYSNIKACPKCYCDHMCFRNNDCCPDYFFTQPMQKCVNFEIFNKNPNNSADDSFYVVDSCQKQTSDDMCMGNDNFTFLEKLRNIPVTSMSTGITYRNKYCAMCNNERNYKEENLSFNCVKFTDFNFLSSVDEILYKLENNLCEIRYKFDSSTKQCNNKNDDKISQCHDTDQVIDKDIVEACHSAYRLSHRVYKNVFCYMCNRPNVSSSETSLFDKCNITELWKPFDPGLQILCDRGMTTPGTEPYKNIFCYFCNRDNSENSTYSDADINVIETLYKENISDIYSYNIYIKSFSIQTYLHQFGDLDLTSSVHTGNNEIRIKDSNEFVNISYLIDRYSNDSMSKDEYCYTKQSEKSLNFSECSSKCFCEEETVFSIDQDIKPCLDVVLRYPAKCQPYTLFSNPQLLESSHKRKSFLSTFGCFNSETSATIKSRCETGIYSDIFSVLPVIDTKRGITYRNIDCFSCNNPLSSINICSKSKVEVFNMIITCNQSLNYAYSMSVFEIFQNARKLQCQIDVAPKTDNMVKNCKTLKNVIRTCNESGTLQKQDKHIQWACEQLDDLIIPKTSCFKNHFCKICNENTSFVCNKSIDDGDDNSPDIEGNNLDNGNAYNQNVLTFHSIFSLQLFGSDEEEGITKENLCNKQQIYDPYKSICRNVTCFPGRIVVNGTCIPLLKTTTNLRYTIVTCLTGNINSTNIDKILNLLEYHIPKQISYETRVETVILESVSMVTNMSTSDPVNNKAHEFPIQILVHMIVHVPSTADRMELEKFLVSFSSNYSIILREVNWTLFTTSFNKDAIFVSTFMTAFGIQRNFSLTKSNLSVVSNKNAGFVFVNKVLQCLQIILEDTEYILDKFDMTLTLLRSGRKLDFSNFNLYTDGKVRICVDHYLKYSTSTENYITHVLVVFTFVCLSVSMLCLILTFITYCLFVSLRSLPGKNNMNLIFSIFLIQLCLILSMFLNGYVILCTTIAICLHYFMLVMFSAMAVCCFHMFRVFSKLRIADTSLDNKNFIYYLSFIYGFPFIIITSNILTFLIISKGQDTGYGGSRCFVKSQISFIVTFFVPILCVCIANIVFFIITASSIRRNPNVASNQSHRLDTLVYVKLFTITGIMWILQIVESQFNASWVSFIVTFLNGCQGFFIFLSYICNKRVYLMYKDMFTKSRLYNSGTLKSDTTRITGTTITRTSVMSGSPKLDSRL